MNKDKALERLTALENEAAELRKILNQEEAYKPWRAAHNKAYWCVKSSGNLGCFYESGDTFDNELYACGNYYPTEEIAIREAEYFNTLRQLRNFSDGLDGEFYIRFRWTTKDFVVDTVSTENKIPYVRFATKERAEAAIKHFGDKLNLIYK